MIEKIRNGDTQAPSWLRSIVILLLWAPVVMLLWAIGIAGIGIGYQIAIGQRAVEIGSLASITDPTLVVGAIAASVAFIYYVLLRVTFGGDTVDEAQDKAIEAKEELDE